MGWTERVPAGIDRSIEEAKMNFHLKKWNPCVVMCRRALEEILQFAFRKFFNQEPKGLDFNAIVRKFEKEKPDVIPKHWIGVLDSVRSLGNVPGAHPSIKRYKFTRVDAEVALLQTNAFREAYFAKIDRG
jgi:HEPN domain-containing protein